MQSQCKCLVSLIREVRRHRLLFLLFRKHIFISVKCFGTGNESRPFTIILTEVRCFKAEIPIQIKWCATIFATGYVLVDILNEAGESWITNKTTSFPNTYC